MFALAENGWTICWDAKVIESLLKKLKECLKLQFAGLVRETNKFFKIPTAVRHSTDADKEYVKDLH